MSADHEVQVPIEQARKASEQSSTLRGVSAFLNNLVMIKPDFGPDDLISLARALQELAGRIARQKLPLSETEVMPGMKAINLAEKDLIPPLAPPKT